MKTTLIIAIATVASFAVGVLTSCSSRVDAQAPISVPPISSHIIGGAK